MLDLFSNTPLHYLLFSCRLVDYVLVNTLFEYILDYLEDTERRAPMEITRIMKSLTPLLSIITSKINPRLRDRYFHLCCQRPASVDPLQQFGDAQTRYTFRTTPVVTLEVNAEIYRSGQDKITFLATMPYLDYKPTSDDMLNLTRSLTAIKTEEAFQTAFVERIIEYLWEETWSVTLICSLVYSVYMLLFSVYIGIEKPYLAYEIVILCMTCFLLVAEGLQAYLLRSRYFQDVWNAADLVQGFLVLVFIALRINGDHHSEAYQSKQRVLAEQWVSSLAILSGYLRWISYLRIYQPTSNAFFCCSLITNTH